MSLRKYQNAGDINLHIAALLKAAQEHRDAGEHSLAEWAEEKARQFQCVRIPRHLS